MATAENNTGPEAEEDNPFTQAARTLATPEHSDEPSNVVPLRKRAARPHDRLPVTGFFNSPPAKSLYHTERAEKARRRAAEEVPEELAAAQRTLIEAGLRRVNAAHADVADHNAMTLAYALKYAACGLHVIDSHAIDPRTGEGTGFQGGKHTAKVPRGSKWQDRASNDRERIPFFWTGDGEYPANKDGEVFAYARVNAPRNVSVAFPEGCGLFVLDIDGEAGKAALAEFEAQYGELPRTAKSVTGSGGWHFIFRGKRPVRNTASKIAPGVDIRGEGGQIIAAPSVHKSGNFYRWDVAPWEVIADAPEWLEELAINASNVSGADKPRQNSRKTGRKPTEANAPRADVHGFDNIVASIGDHDGGVGFDGPIYRAACSWFATHGAGAAAEELIESLRTAVLDAWCEDDRALTRYSTEDYLVERVAQARSFIAENADEEEQVHVEGVDASETPEERAAAFDTSHSEADLRRFIAGLIQDGADATTRVNVIAAIAKNTNYGKVAVRNLWKDEAAKRKPAKEEEAEGVAVVNQWDFTELHEYGSRCIHDANRKSPSVFHHVHDLCVIRRGSDERYSIKELNKERFAHHLNTVARYVKVSGEDQTQIGVAAPREVVAHLFADDYSQYPALRGMVGTPSFTAEGTLLVKPGYDWNSKIFFQPDLTLNIPEVCAAPSPEQVFEAKRLLVQEILADFMLDGMDRAETLRKGLCCEEVPNLKDRVSDHVHALPILRRIPGLKPEAAPSLAHAIVMAVFPFVREMITGNAPGIAIDKQKPGAGAGKLEAAMSTIYGGRGTSALALPTTPEEMTKVLLPMLRGGRPNIFFDNVTNVESSELASAMTAPTLEARVLGVSETVEVEVRCQWVIAGIKLRLSDELTRRFALIYLDPKTATPEMRSGFRNPDVEAWVRGNRDALIWACLTLVQNWIAGGRQPGSKDKASYSQWARVMGGILDAAEIVGFLENEKDMKARSSVSDDPVRQLVERLAEFENGTLFVTGSVAKRHPEGTQSVRVLLEDFHEDEDGDSRVLRLTGWGYNQGDGRYTSPEKVAFGWKRDVVGEPHKVGDLEISFEPVANTSGSKLWKLVKR